MSFSGSPHLQLSARVRGQEYVSIGSFPLEGWADAGLAGQAAKDDGPTFEGRTLEKDGDGYGLEIRYRSPLWSTKKVTLEFRPAFFLYGMAIEGANPDQKLKIIHYSAREGSEGGIEYGKGEFEEVASWTPDLYDALLPAKGISVIFISSHHGAYLDSFLRGFSAGSHIMPPYVAVVRSGEAWWGVGTMGVPAVRDGLHLSISHDTFAVTFETGVVAPVGRGWVAAPKVGFFFGKESGEALEAYNRALVSEGLVKKSPPRKWSAW